MGVCCFRLCLWVSLRLLRVRMFCDCCCRVCVYVYVLVFCVHAHDLHMLKSIILPRALLQYMVHKKHAQSEGEETDKDTRARETRERWDEDERERKSLILRRPDTEKRAYNLSKQSAPVARALWKIAEYFHVFQILYLLVCTLKFMDGKQGYHHFAQMVALPMTVISSKVGIRTQEHTLDIRSYRRCIVWDGVCAVHD